MTLEASTVKLVSEQANEAVEAVIGYFKTRIPSEVADEIQNLALGHNGEAEEQ